MTNFITSLKKTTNDKTNPGKNFITSLKKTTNDKTNPGKKVYIYIYIYTFFPGLVLSLVVTQIVFKLLTYSLVIN